MEEVGEAYDLFIEGIDQLIPKMAESEPPPPPLAGVAATSVRTHFLSHEILGAPHAADVIPEEILDEMTEPTLSEAPESEEELQEWARQAASKIDEEVPQAVREMYRQAYVEFGRNVYTRPADFVAGKLKLPPVRVPTRPLDPSEGGSFC